MQRIAGDLGDQITLAAEQRGVALLPSFARPQEVMVVGGARKIAIWPGDTVATATIVATPIGAGSAPLAGGFGSSHCPHLAF